MRGDQRPLSTLISILSAFCLVAGSSALAQVAALPTVGLTLNANQFEPGQTLQVGLNVQNPAGNPPADLYVGALLPDRQTIVFFTASGAIAGVVNLANPALFPPTQVAPAGFGLNEPSFLQFTFPTMGVAPGTYILFAALVRQGALQDNQIDDADILDFDIQGLTFSTGSQLNIPPGQSLAGCVDTFTGKGVVDAETLIAFGGSPLSGYTWTLSNLATFPAGTTVEPLTGIFRGTGGALVPGVHTFEMTVSDGSSTANGTFVFTVETASSAPVGGIPGVGCGAAVFQQSSLAIIELPDATAGAGYGASLFVTIGGGRNAANLPLSWSLATGQLPPGLVIDAARGVVRGTPFSSAAGQTFTFTVTVRDSSPQPKTAICPNAGRCPTYVISVR